MAELKPLGRQIPQPNAPDLSGAAEAYGAMGQTIQKVAQTGVEIADTYNRLEAQAQYTETLNQLNKELVNSLTPENIAQGGAYDRYIANAEAIIKGGMELTPRRYKSELENDLRQNVNRLGLTIGKAQLSFESEARKAEGQAILHTKLRNLHELIEEGDDQKINYERSLVDQTLQDLKDTGAITENEVVKIKDQVDDVIVNKDYLNTYNSLLRSDPIAADKMQKELSDNKPANLTYNQWYQVQASLLEAKARRIKAVDAAETTGINEFNLAFTEGKLKDPIELDSWMAEQEAQGRYFSPDAKLKMQTKIAELQRKAAAEAETVLAISHDVTNNPDNLYNYTDSEKSNWVNVKSAEMLQSFEKAKAQNPDLQIPSQLAIKGSLVQGLPSVPSSFSNELSDKLRYGNIDEFRDAVEVASRLERGSQRAYSSLPKETQAFHQLTGQLMANTRLPIEDIKQLADKTINKKDTATQEKIDKELTKIHRTGKLGSLYNDVYETKFVNPALQPFYNVMTDTFDAFYQLTGDEDIAKKLTVNAMKGATGKSKYIPPNDVTKHPIEETDLYKKHPTLVQNQMALTLHQIIESNKRAEEKGMNISPKVEWPDGIAQPNWATLTGKQMNEEPIFQSDPLLRGASPKEITPVAKVNGKNRKLFFMNPDTKLETPGKDQREIWYEDEFGIAKPLFVLNEEKVGERVKNSQGVPLMELKPIEEITPEIAAIKQRKAREDLAVRHLREEFRAIKPKREAKFEALPEGTELKPYNPLTQTKIAPRYNPLSRERVDKLLATQREEEKFINENLERKVAQIIEAEEKRNAQPSA